MTPARRVDAGDGPDPDPADPLAAAIELVGSRWSLLIVAALLDATKRYVDLQRELGVPTNMLATRLRELQSAGVVARILLFHNSRAYELTERGRGLAPTIDALRAWGASAPSAHSSMEP